MTLTELATPLVHPFLTTGLKTVTLALGALITLFAYRAYDRTGARALGALALGFAFVTLGALLAGAIDLLLAVPRRTALVVESLLYTIGFAVILYSLYAGE